MYVGKGANKRARTQPIAIDSLQFALVVHAFSTALFS